MLDLQPGMLSWLVCSTVPKLHDVMSALPAPGTCKDSCMHVQLVWTWCIMQ